MFRNRSANAMREVSRIQAQRLHDEVALRRIASGKQPADYDLPFTPLPDHRRPNWGGIAALVAILMITGLVAGLCSWVYWGGWL